MPVWAQDSVEVSTGSTVRDSNVKALLRSADAELRRAYLAALGLALCWAPAKYGQGWIRTSEGVSQQIYSLPRLATSVPTRDGTRGSPFCNYAPRSTAKAANFASCVYRTPPCGLQAVFGSLIAPQIRTK
jgi:hypothetical protein